MFSKTANRQDGFAPASMARQSPAAVIVRALRLYWARRRTGRILYGLDDASLKDIGLQRGMVDSAFNDVRYSPRF